MSGAFTRRKAIQWGALAGAAAALGPLPSLARAAAGATPAYLRRSSYAPLLGQPFTIDGGALTLEVVADLAGARSAEYLRGHDEAFMLGFDGPPGLGAGIHDFRHRDLGSFLLFAGPVGEPADGRQRYEVVVDRSTRPTAKSPAPTAPSTPASTPGADLSSGEAAAPGAAPAGGSAAAPAASPARRAAPKRAKRKRRHVARRRPKARHPRRKPRRR